MGVDDAVATLKARRRLAAQKLIVEVIVADSVVNRSDGGILGLRIGRLRGRGRQLRGRCYGLHRLSR
jgi:hypothetical protein